MLIGQSIPQRQLILIRTPNSFIKVKGRCLTHFNCIKQVLYGPLFDYCLINSIVSKLGPYLLEYILIYKSRHILLIIINILIILLGQLFSFYNNSLIYSTDGQILIQTLLDNNIIGLVPLY
jgi:hypothetical protein